MAIQVLGPLVADGSGRLGPRDRVVLEALTLRQGHPVPAEELVDALWGESPPASATKNLQSCIVRLRKALGTEAIETTPHGYVLALPPDQVDARRFENDVARARQLLSLGESDRAVFLLDQALDLWRGEAFDELRDWQPARQEAGRLLELRREAEELRLEARLARGLARESIPLAHEMVRAAPLRERRWELLALAQYRCGSQGEALRTIRQLRAVLARELGIDPSPEVLALEQSILRQDPGLLVPESAPVNASCPWLGLKVYDVGDADWFFGRDADVAAALSILETRSFAVLAGPSGSGKSSVLRAGVLAAVRRRRDRYVLLTPGHHPTRALSALPDDAPPTTVLAIDQAEELFHLCDDLDERRAFLDRVVVEAGRRPVVMTVRGDRLAQVSEHAGVSRLVEQGLHLVGGLDEAGLREAVEGPARQAGLLVEHGLVELLLHEVREDPGALPLLSHALLETWRRREGNTLTVEGYHAAGGIRGAVAQSAERLYGAIDAEQRTRLRHLLLKLVSSAEGEPVRIPVPRRLIAADPEHDALIEQLVGARLVTSDDGVLEVTHEALARAWPRLRGWLDDDVDGQRIRHHLSATADAWDSLGRPDSELYRGVRLARALDWQQSGAAGGLTRTELDFLDASRAESEAAERSAVERERLQAGLIRRLRGVLTAAVVLLVLALAGIGVAAVQTDRARDNAAAAEESALRAVAGRAAAASQQVGDVDVSLLVAIAALRLDDTTETRNSLLATIRRWPELYASTPIEGSPMSVDVSPDGRHVAVLDESHHLRLYDARTGALVDDRALGEAKVRFSDAYGRHVLFSPDGSLLAVTRTAGLGRALSLFSVTDRLRALPLPGVPRGAWAAGDLTFDGDGSRLAVGLTRVGDPPAGARHTAQALVWDLAAGGPPARFDLGGAPEAPVTLTADGTTLFTGQPLTRHSLETGISTVLDRAPRHGYWSLHVLPAGRGLLALLNSEAVLMDFSGKVISRFPTDGYTSTLRVPPRGKRFLGIDGDTREAVEWRVADPAVPMRRVRLDQGSTNAVDYAADGRAIVASGRGGNTLRRWDLTGRRTFVGTVPTSSGWGATFGVLSEDARQSVTVWGGWVITDYPTGDVTFIDPPRDGYRHTYGAFHPDGRHFTTAVGEVVREWRLGEEPQVEARAEFPGQLVSEIDYTPDGDRLVVSEVDGTVTMLDADLERVGTPVEVGTPVHWIVARPDRRTAVVLTGGLELPDWVVPTTGWALVDLEEGRIVRRGTLQVRYVHWLAVSPDGTRMAVSGGQDGEAVGNAGAEGHLEVIDVTTGQPIGPPRSWPGTSRSHIGFSPDGTRLVTSSSNGLVRVWDVATLTELQTLAFPRGTKLSARFQPDGRSVRMFDWSSGTAYDWDLSTEHAVAYACLAAGRQLTEAEWATYFGDLPYQQTCSRPPAPGS